MEYKIATEISRIEIEKKINTLMTLGWKPVGGLSVTAERGLCFFQAMVKDQENPVDAAERLEDELKETANTRPRGRGGLSA